MPCQGASANPGGSTEQWKGETHRMGWRCDFPGGSQGEPLKRGSLGGRGMEEGQPGKDPGRAEGKALMSSAICASSLPPTPALLFILPRTAVSVCDGGRGGGVGTQDCSAIQLPACGCFYFRVPFWLHRNRTRNVTCGLTFSSVCLGLHSFRNGRWRQSGETLALGGEGPALPSASCSQMSHLLRVTPF